MSTLGDVQYIEGYYDSCGGDIVSTWGWTVHRRDIIHDCIRGIS